MSEVDDLRQNVARVVGAAVTEYVTAWLDAEDDEDRQSEAREALDEAVGPSARNLSNYDRANLSASLQMMSLGNTAAWATTEEEVVREATHVLRESAMDRYHDDFDRGERKFVWPPDADSIGDWDLFRVIVGRFIEAHHANIATVARCRGGMMRQSPVELVGQGALFFLAAWLQATSRVDLLEDYEDDDITAWECFLELPSKSA